MFITDKFSLKDLDPFVVQVNDIDTIVLLVSIMEGSIKEN